MDSRRAYFLRMTKNRFVLVLVSSLVILVGALLFESTRHGHSDLDRPGQSDRATNELQPSSPGTPSTKVHPCRVDVTDALSGERIPAVVETRRADDGSVLSLEANIDHDLPTGIWRATAHAEGYRPGTTRVLVPGRCRASLELVPRRTQLLVVRSDQGPVQNARVVARPFATTTHSGRLLATPPLRAFTDSHGECVLDLLPGMYSDIRISAVGHQSLAIRIMPSNEPKTVTLRPGVIVIVRLTGSVSTRDDDIVVELVSADGESISKVIPVGLFSDTSRTPPIPMGSVSGGAYEMKATISGTPFLHRDVRIEGESTELLLDLSKAVGLEQKFDVAFDVVGHRDGEAKLQIEGRSGRPKITVPVGHATRVIAKLASGRYFASPSTDRTVGEWRPLRIPESLRYEMRLDSPSQVPTNIALRSSLVGKLRVFDTPDQIKAALDVSIRGPGVLGPFPMTPGTHWYTLESNGRAYRGTLHVPETGGRTITLAVPGRIVIDDDADALETGSVLHVNATRSWSAAQLPAIRLPDRRTHAVSLMAGHWHVAVTTPVAVLSAQTEVEEGRETRVATSTMKTETLARLRVVGVANLHTVRMERIASASARRDYRIGVDGRIAQGFAPGTYSYTLGNDTGVVELRAGRELTLRIEEPQSSRRVRIRANSVLISRRVGDGVKLVEAESVGQAEWRFEGSGRVLAVARRNKRNVGVFVDAQEPSTSIRETMTPLPDLFANGIRYRGRLVIYATEIDGESVEAWLGAPLIVWTGVAGEGETAILIPLAAKRMRLRAVARRKSGRYESQFVVPREMDKTEMQWRGAGS